MKQPTLTSIPITQIRDNPFQTRSEYGDIDELAADIERNGLLQLPIGRLMFTHAALSEPEVIAGDMLYAVEGWLEEGAYMELAFGHRRLRACRQLGWEEMPVTLKPLDDAAMARMAWAENAERKDITAIEEAQALQRMMEQFEWTQAEVGEEVGLSRSAVANKLRLLGLPAEAQEAIQDGRMTEKHGRAILRLAPAGKETVANVLESTIAGDAPVSSRSLEDEVKAVIEQYTSMPAEEISVPNDWGGENRVEARGFELDWAPEDLEDGILGACEGCEFMVQFNGEDFPRCGNQSCYDRKTKHWRQLALQVQIEAAQAAFKAETGHDIEMSRKQPWDNYEFGVTWSAPLELLDKGLCSSENCECLALGYLSDHRVEDAVRPDAENAPNICLVCTSSGRLANRRRALEKEEDPEKEEREKAAKRAAKEETDKAKALLRKAFKVMSIDDLAQNDEFMRQLAARLYLGSDNGELTAEEMWEKLFWKLAEHEVSRYNYGHGLDYWSVDVAKEWVEDLKQYQDAQPQEEEA